MKLVCNVPQEDSPPQTQLYQDVKSFYQYIETSNGFSVQMIQALLLIALYEVGHGIYPAAYLTIGNAARIGRGVGLHDQAAPQMLPRCSTWTEQEERRRLWWGIVVLDRFANIGHRRKPLATTDPPLQAHLPTDDEAWAAGNMDFAAPLLSASSTAQASSYARICQASHLLGKIVWHLDDKLLPADYKFADALQVHRTTLPFADVIAAEVFQISTKDSSIRASLCTSVAITYSALLTLYDGYSCTSRMVVTGSEDQLEMQQQSIEGLSEISQRAIKLSRMLRDLMRSDETDRLSPMVIDCIYQAGANYAWGKGESSESNYTECLLELKELLGFLNRRWKVAGQWLASPRDNALEVAS